MATNTADLQKFIQDLKQGLLTEARKYEDFTFDDLVTIFYFINQVENYISKNTPDKDETGIKIHYYKWRVGITDNIAERKKTYDASPEEYNNTQLWNDWDCGNDKVSRNVERFFKRCKKTQGDEGGGDNPKFIYCFYIGK